MVCGAALLAALCVPVRASETISYTYDALGRLTNEAHSGSVNSGVQNAIGYDPAGNRSSYAVTGGVTPITLSIADASATEGGSLSFVVTRGGSTASAVTVSYATANGTATSGSDYTAASGTLTFAIGDTTKTITVATIDNTTVEPTETFTLALSNPTTGVTLSRATATGTITDNDSAPITATNPVLSYSSAQVVTIPITTLATLNGNSATISAFSAPAGSGTASIAGDGQSVTFTAETIAKPVPCDPAEVDHFTVPYTIRNSATGATVSGSSALTVTGPAGGRPTGGGVCP